MLFYTESQLTFISITGSDGFYLSLEGFLFWEGP